MPRVQHFPRISKRVWRGRGPAQGIIGRIFRIGRNLWKAVISDPSRRFSRSKIFTRFNDALGFIVDELKRISRVIGD